MGIRPSAANAFSTHGATNASAFRPVVSGRCGRLVPSFFRAGVREQHGPGLADRGGKSRNGRGARRASGGVGSRVARSRRRGGLVFGQSNRTGVLLQPGRANVRVLDRTGESSVTSVRATTARPRVSPKESSESGGPVRGNSSTAGRTRGWGLGIAAPEIRAVRKRSTRVARASLRPRLRVRSRRAPSA